MQSKEEGPQHYSNKGSDVGRNRHGVDAVLLLVCMPSRACCSPTSRVSNLCACLLHWLGSAGCSGLCSCRGACLHRSVRVSSRSQHQAQPNSHSAGCQKPLQGQLALLLCWWPLSCRAPVGRERREVCGLFLGSSVRCFLRQSSPPLES